MGVGVGVDVGVDVDVDVDVDGDVGVDVGVDVSAASDWRVWSIGGARWGSMPNCYVSSSDVACGPPRASSGAERLRRRIRTSHAPTPRTQPARKPTGKAMHATRKP